MRNSKSRKETIVKTVQMGKEIIENMEAMIKTKEIIHSKKNSNAKMM